jgi:hypothetical protein
MDTKPLAPLETWLTIMARTDTVSVVMVEVLQPVQFAQLLKLRDGKLGERVVRYTRNALASRDVDASEECKVNVFVFGHCPAAKFSSLKQAFHQELETTGVQGYSLSGDKKARFKVEHARFKFHFTLTAKLGIVEWRVPSDDEWPPTPSEFLERYETRWEMSID